MTQRTAKLVLLALVSMAIAACGGGQSPSGRSSGKIVFSEHCSVCHSLTGHDDPRLQGGDLLGFHAGRTEIRQFVREMPVVHRPLTQDELGAVVDYVMAAERRAARR
jgi:mono/diheme cytochrome c family protein